MHKFYLSHHVSACARKLFYVENSRIFKFEGNLGSNLHPDPGVPFAAPLTKSSRPRVKSMSCPWDPRPAARHCGHRNPPHLLSQWPSPSSCSLDLTSQNGGSLCRMAVLQVFSECSFQGWTCAGFRINETPTPVTTENSANVLLSAKPQKQSSTSCVMPFLSSTHSHSCSVLRSLSPY